MQLCVPLKALTFLFVTLFNPFLSASSRNRPPKHARLALPTDNVALSPVTFGTPLKNLSLNLGNLLMKTPIGKVFYIQAMKGDSQTEYFYGINFYETDPFFLATYTIECGLINEQLAPIIIHSFFKKTASLGLNPEAAVFFPSAHLHGHCHTPRAHGSHTLQPLSAPLTHYQEPPMHALPHIPPLISSILSYRKSALIDAMQQQGDVKYEVRHQNFSDSQRLMLVV